MSYYIEPTTEQIDERRQGGSRPAAEKELREEALDRAMDRAEMDLYHREESRMWEILDTLFDVVKIMRNHP